VFVGGDPFLPLPKKEVERLKDVEAFLSKRDNKHVIHVGVCVALVIPRDLAGPEQDMLDWCTLLLLCYTTGIHDKLCLQFGVGIAWGYGPAWDWIYGL
jgi:hypothetical protein